MKIILRSRLRRTANSWILGNRMELRRRVTSNEVKERVIDSHDQHNLIRDETLVFQVHRGVACTTTWPFEYWQRRPALASLTCVRLP